MKSAEVLPASAGRQTVLQASDSRGDTLAVLGIAGAVVLVHMLTNGRYGFHRDELQVLSDARHMDWGFVAYPPFTPFVERIAMSLFGLSLVGLRLFSVIANAVAIVVTGLMARELGGGRLAQVTAALTTALSPLAMFEGTEFQYTTFDYLWWVLIAYFVIRLLKTDNPRWWQAIGPVIGLGFMTKYTMGFYLAGILGGVVLTRTRRYLASPWFWGGMTLGFLVCVPNLIWQAQHGFMSLHFLQHIHQRDVGQGRANGFWRDQLMICTNLMAAPLWIAGLVGFLRDRRCRMLGWMYVIPLVLFVVGKGRGYYVGAAYPTLMAMGAVMGERWVGAMSRGWRLAVELFVLQAVVVFGSIVSAMVVPFASGGWLKSFALKNNGDLRGRSGGRSWCRTLPRFEMRCLRTNARVLAWLLAIMGRGAIEILGPQFGLPMPISGTNSAWLRGYPQPPPSTLIVVGHGQKYIDRMFTTCRVAGHNGNALGVHNEESDDHPDIYVCGAPKLPGPEFWKEYQAFG